METKELSRAYKELLAAAESITDDRPLAEFDRAEVDWVLAHIALSDRALAGTARDVLAGRAARIDNAQVMSRAAIAAVLCSTTHLERVDMVRRNAKELVDLLEQIPQEAAGTAVRAQLVDREGMLVFDDDLKWGDVIRMRAMEHIPGHAATLLARAHFAIEG
ncbi:hypothetical protein GCM10020367_58270 [Streptomyces sannanensis]|uniref:DinB-like domain-containing protein n=1 Tax=Streptomyces sannanensis TaxID=285536 RepID=A0ABP6SK32_9ACTN